jgi:hypothetical protein
MIDSRPDRWEAKTSREKSRWLHRGVLGAVSVLLMVAPASCEVIAGKQRVVAD